MDSFKHIFKNALNRQPVPFIRRVQAVWHIALGIAILGIVAMIVFSLFLFAKIQNDTLFQSQVSTSEIDNLIKQTRLESVLKEFDAKAENFKSVNLNEPKISDPSL